MAVTVTVAVHCFHYFVIPRMFSKQAVMLQDQSFAVQQILMWLMRLSVNVNFINFKELGTQLSRLSAILLIMRAVIVRSEFCWLRI
jgi:hypothetical protein